jgi:hypothetical protein
MTCSLAFSCADQYLHHLDLWDSVRIAIMRICCSVMALPVCIHSHP